MMPVIKNKPLQYALLSLGWISLALGFVGIFLPVLPTTPFILLSAWCFIRSSPKAHAWIYNHRLFGPPLKNWEQNRSISLKAKITALVMIALSALIILYKIQNPWIKFPTLTLLLTISLFISTRKGAR